MIQNKLKKNVKFKFGTEIKKVSRNGERYELFYQDGAITKADVVIYAGGFKSSTAILEEPNILKPSFGQQDYIKSFKNFNLLI